MITENARTDRDLGFLDRSNANEGIKTKLNLK